MMLGQRESHLEKDENESKSHTEINSKWIRDPNVKHETKDVWITGELFYNLEVRKASQNPTVT